VTVFVTLREEWMHRCTKAGSALKGGLGDPAGSPQGEKRIGTRPLAVEILWQFDAWCAI
jgi:hypothetical protein